MGWPRIHMWQLSICRDISAAGIPLRSEASQFHTGCPFLKHKSWKEEPHNMWLWKSVGVLSGRNGKLPVEGLMHTLTLSWAPEEGQWLGSQQRHTGRDKLCGFKARAGWTATVLMCWILLPHSCQASAIFPVMIPLCSGQIWIFLSLVNTTHPTLRTPWDPSSHNSRTTGGSFSGCVSQEVGLQWWASGVPCTFY